LKGFYRSKTNNTVYSTSSLIVCVILFRNSARVGSTTSLYFNATSLIPFTAYDIQVRFWNYIFFYFLTIIKFGLHLVYQRFCDHGRNVAWVNSRFCRICNKCLRELTQCLTLSHFAQTFLTNPSKLRICPCKIPTVITETLIV
jgi:hypothetical protein